MDRPQNGGAAFPMKWTAHNQEGSFDMHNKGMSLRDYFAAKAMAVLAGPVFIGAEREEAYAKHAKHCYELADAMLKARG